MVSFASTIANQDLIETSISPRNVTFKTVKPAIYWSAIVRKSVSCTPPQQNKWESLKQSFLFFFFVSNFLAQTTFYP